MNRRGFIQLGAASVATMALRSAGLMPALAASAASYQALVCVFLFGGNDSNNMIVPTDDANFTAYTTLRANLALPASGLTAPVTSVSGAPYAFHASMPEMASLFTSKELAVVANVGPLIQPLTRAQYQAQSVQYPLPSNLFSHSDQQEAWQSSIAQGRANTGWGGRLADYLAAEKINATNFPSFFSVAGNQLQGNGANTTPVALNPGQSLTLTGFSNPKSSAGTEAIWTQLNNLLTLGNGVSLVQAADNVLSDSIADASALTAALSKAPTLKTTFPTTSLGAQLKQVAQVISVQSALGISRQIFFVSLGGFDTHTNELTTHATLYPQVSQALSAFYNATQELGQAQNVTTFTESDFTRTFQPTTSGSDHGWGGHHLVLGGAVKGGQIYGQFPTFQLGGPNDTDTRGRWIPTISTDQYGATLSTWFGVPQTALATIFPNLTNFSTSNLGFLG